MGAQIHGLQIGLDISESRHHYNPYLGVHLLYFVKKLQTVHLRHLDIRDHEVELLVHRNGNGFITILGRLHIKTFLLQDLRQSVTDMNLIINNEDGLFVRMGWLGPSVVPLK